jgi:hypothetical protein
MNILIQVNNEEIENKYVQTEPETLTGETPNEPPHFISQPILNHVLGPLIISFLCRICLAYKRSDKGRLINFRNIAKNIFSEA